MMYVEFMKNYILADSGEQMPVRLISAPEPKTFCSYFRDMIYFEFMKIFLSPIPAIRKFLPPDFCLLSTKTFCSYFLDMMYVEFMKNYILADSGEQMPVRLISAPEPKTFCSYFRDMMYVEFIKNFRIADSGEQMPVRLSTAS